MEDISSNIKKVLFVFLVLFIALISYITFFEIKQGPTIVDSQYNKRLWVKRNEVLRGTIFDRNMKPLTKSTRVDQLTQKREYTGGELFAHVLGYVDVKYGITGLEKKYDEELTANDSEFLKTAMQKLLKIDDSKKQEKIGHGLKTTLDMNLQKTAYDLLGNNKGAVVALNPKTGEILAVVSKPSYNPNNLKDIWAGINKDENTPLINRATSGLYPPGSTFKTITAISALENINNITNRKFQDEGKLVFNSKESLSNFNGEVLGNISFKEAYVYSSNFVFGSLGLELGNSKLKATAEKFYFNKDIPADGVVVEDSKFPELKKYEKGNIAQSAIGQGAVLATPMQMALLTSTIANGGEMMEPYLVSEILNKDGTSLEKIQSKSLGNVITKQNSDIMKQYMRGVVAEGTGVGASIEGIDVSGKTGTADHKADGKDSPPHSWFIGFAPYDNPKIAIAVIVEDGGQGGIAAAKIAAQVMKTALK